MPISAQTPRAIGNPEIPYDKLRFGIQINTSIDRQSGRLRATGTLVLTRCRVLPAVAPATEGPWEDDPAAVPVIRPLGDVFALAGQLPAVATALAAVQAAVDAYNAANHLV